MDCKQLRMIIPAGNLMKSEYMCPFGFLWIHCSYISHFTTKVYTILDVQLCTDPRHDGSPIHILTICSAQR